MEITEKAYAKINLFLDVIGKRKDGFHDIVSVMHAVSLADEITVTAEKAEYTCITIEVENNADVPNDERNLAYIAAERFLEKTGLDANVKIHIYKYIPAAAGLGGGSSDAAAVLRGLNRLFDKPLDERSLCALASEIGSDVPFCLLGGTRLCEGRGEKMTEFPYEDRFFVIHTPVAEKVSTPKAYALLDEAFDDFKEDGAALHESLLSFFREDNIFGMYNVFESVILPTCPEAEEARDQLILLGAATAMMSGSGCAVFGVFDHEEAALAAARELPAAVVCRSAPSLCEQDT